MPPNAISFCPIEFKMQPILRSFRRKNSTCRPKRSLSDPSNSRCNPSCFLSAEDVLLFSRRFSPGYFFTWHVCCEELSDLIPCDRLKHVRHRLSISLTEVRQRLHKMNVTELDPGELLLEETHHRIKTVLLRQHVQVNEVTLGAAAGDGTQFHGRNITRIGYLDPVIDIEWKEHGIVITNETQFYRTNVKVQRLRGFRDYRDSVNGLQHSQQEILIEQICS